MKTTTTVAIAVLSLLPLAGVSQAEPAHVSNAEMQAACAVPANRDLNVTRIVHNVGVRRGVSAKVMLAGFEAGWVESHMNNLNCGDRDSLGVFQQRPSQGWGTPEQIMNVDYAADRFFAEAQRVEPKYPNLSAGLLADKVQRSCCPARYDQAEAKARQMLDEVRISVYGDIGVKWRAMGAENSVVGAPISNEQPGAPGGRWQGFQRGNIYWTPALNAHPVYGEILTKFMNTGDEHRWGYPVNDEQPGAPGGRWQKFQNANFYWTSSTGAFPVFGEILTNFMNNGDEHRWGYPLMEEAVGANNGRWQKFQNGIWYWSARTSAYPVYGDILQKFGTTGDEHTHGYPKEAEKDWTGEPGGRMQTFENSTFYWTPAKGAWSVGN
ncbi:LGFP repeat-containing protein [Lentzea sp. NPDC054927]